MEEEINYIKSDNISHLGLGVIEQPSSSILDSNFNRIVTVHNVYESLSLKDKVFVIESLQNWMDDQIHIIKNELLNHE